MAKESEFLEALRKLRGDLNSFSGAKRVELANALGRYFESGKTDPNALALVSLLSNDSKWEVRSAIAGYLQSLPEETQIKLIPQFSTDTNIFVRRATDVAIAHRRQKKRTQQKQQKGLEHIQSDFESLRSLYGDKAAMRARKMVERMYELLVGTAAHELLGRMTPLKSDTAQLLGRVRARDVNYKAFEDALEDMGDRLAYIERFLGKLKTYATAVAEERHRSRLSDVVAEAHHEALEKMLPENAKGVKFLSAVPENIHVAISRVDFVVALSDLIKNAFEAFKDFRSKDALVQVEARKLPNDVIQLKISDNGCGMSEEDLAVVQRFIPGKSSKKVKGTGIGVPNAQRVVLAHGGLFQLESKFELGTTITITVPVHAKGD